MANKEIPPLKTFSSTLLEQTNIEPPAFIIDRFMPCGLGALGAQPKTGKSWLSLDLGLSVATGKDFWGMKTRSGNVLILALEDSGYRLKERLKMLGGTFPPNLSFVIRDTLTLRNGLIHQLSGWIESVEKPSLIIIDTLARIRGIGGSRNTDAYNQDTALYSGLQELALKSNIAVLAITHQRKQGSILLDDEFERITGSNGLFALCDFVWLITGKRTDREKTLHITGRDIEQGTYKIAFDGCRWSMLGSTEDMEKQHRIDDYMESPIRKTILELLRLSGSWSGSASALMYQTNRYTDANFDNPKLFGLALSKIKDFLSDIDHIAVEQDQGGRYGRDYRFYFS